VSEPEARSRREAPLARSPIRPAAPLVVLDGWEVSGRRATGALTLTDCTPLTKVQIKAPVTGQVATELGVPFGRSRPNGAGVLVVGSGPGEWLLLGPPGRAEEITAWLTDLTERATKAGEAFASSTDLTHGRALMRLTGARAADVLAAVCGIDLSDDATPDGAAFRSAVAAVATDVVRDDVAGTRSYLLHCERSSGQYLFDALLSAGRELDIEVDGFTAPKGESEHAIPE
jgi:heterotetrameric sarcosine oxidase gamma subunit